MTRTGAGQGWADVWKQSYFTFEYKATPRNLGEALKQLMTYISSKTKNTIVHTAHDDIWHWIAKRNYWLPGLLIS